MSSKKTNRREFLCRGIAAWAAAQSALPALAAASQARVVGANERIHLGLIGCGGRGRWIIRNMVRPAKADTALVAVNDVWKHRLETYPAEVEKAAGRRPEAFADYRKLLDEAPVDAVIIATPAHQHCGQTIDAVEAGKHVYVEKPIAPVRRDLEDLNRCHDAVRASKLAVQNGTQGVSGAGARAVKDLISSGSLGKLFRVEGSESLAVPYWIHYRGPKTAAETDWKAFLYNREDRPFDAHQHASWMGYHDFSSGAIGGWMSHFINFVHFATGCGSPRQATAFGGRYAPTNDPRCDAPDQVTVVLEYDEGFHTQFVSHFGSSVDNETVRFFFEKGSVRTRFGHHVGNPVVSSESGETKKLLDFDPPYPGTAHVEDWFDSIRGGGPSSADMDFGYKQGVAVLLGDAAYSLGRRVAFDGEKREIRPAPGPA